jgi:hypothetical protein
MKVRPQTRGDRAHFKARARDSTRTHVPRETRLQWHPNFVMPTTCNGRSEDKINQIRRTMLHERIKVCVKIHPLGLTLLLVHIRNPDQRYAPPCESLANLWDEKVRDEARIQTSRSKNEQVSVMYRVQCARRGSYISRI